MKAKFQLTTIAVLLGMSGISQAALTVSTGPIAFNGSASVTASGTSVASAINNNNGATAANVALGQFNPTLGVLIGVDLQLTSNRHQVIDGTGYKNNGPGRDASGNGSSTAAMLALGAAANFSTAISQTGGSCALAHGPTGYTQCSWGPNSSAETTNATVSVDGSNLDDYVGNGSVNAALTLPSLQATTTLSRTQGQTSGSTTNYSVDWAGDLQANYNYLLHAQASFSGSSLAQSLTLDFGDVAQNSSSAALSFSLFNMANADGIGLDLDSITISGDSDAFSTDLAAFTALEQGSNLAFFANFLTSTTGAFNAQYLLNLSDADLGASSTRHNYQLTLNLMGNVTPVPVPGAVWLFGSAVLGLMSIGRRKQPA